MSITMQFFNAADQEICADSYRIEVNGNVCRIPGINAEISQDALHAPTQTTTPSLC